VITICDVGPRDGLQNESTVLSPATRAELVRRLAAAGLCRIEAVSFVHPRRVPAMAGAEDVMASLERRPGVTYSGLVLNEKGYDRALAAGVDLIDYAFPVTDGFARRNQNTTTEAALELCGRLARRARQDGIPFTVGLICAFGCPFDGPVAPAHVLRIAERVMAEPPDELAVADTIGVGVPTQARELVRGLRSLGVRTGVHLHDTRNTGIANAVAALEEGAEVLDSSVGGSGGCPFAPRATGNVATDDLAYVLRGMGVETGIDLDALIAVTHWLEERLGKQLPSMVARAGDYPVAS
jgi:hydroxymethylglutaryl-CoA lyase/(R)-citramalyl-CoA lyase